MTFKTLEALILEVVAHPDEAYIQSSGKMALVFDTERKAILVVKGNFEGLPEEVAWELRKAIKEQHPEASV